MHGIVQRNLVTRVKGNEESTYRQGDVNLTPADLGAVNEDFSTYSTAGTPFAGSEYVILRSGNTNVKTDIATLTSQIGGGSGSEQTALVNYKKIISSVGGTGSFSQTFQDNNITGDMVLLEAQLDDPSIQTSDWTITCSDSNSGQVTISGSANGTTSVTLYFGVGMSTTPTVLTNLSSNSADNLLKVNPRPGVTGTLGTLNGGTGVSATDTADLISKLGITSAISMINAQMSLNDCDANQIVQLNNYTDPSNPFVLPYDGYISLSGGSSDNGYIRVVIRSPSREIQPYMYMNVTGVYQQQSMFVKKGMTVYVLANTVQTSTITYFPLTK